MYVRKLKLLGIGVQFEKEGIFTLALGDEMLLNTFSAIAQEESKAISQNQRLSIVKRMEDGEYVDSNAPYGFRLMNKELTVYEPEAEIVRSIFRMYLNGCSTTEIARELNNRRIQTKTGKGTWRSAKVAYSDRRPQIHRVDLKQENLDMKKIRYIPYGYTIRNGRTVIEHGEADVIREIFDAYISGASLKAIAEELTGRKIPYSERTDTWDKARIARIIDNAKYTGDDEYDPIIDEALYETAISLKTARQRNTFEKDTAAINLLRDYIRCQQCGAPMKRRVSTKHRIRESWMCTNDECGIKVRIRDTQLLEKVNVLMNRIINNTRLLIPRRKKRPEMSPAVLKLNNEISLELERDNPNEELIIAKTAEMASQLYRESETRINIAASIARKRAEMMTPQEEFSESYFTDLVSYISLDDGGRITLHTKTDTEIGDDDNASNQDTEKDNHGH